MRRLYDEKVTRQLPPEHLNASAEIEKFSSSKASCGTDPHAFGNAPGSVVLGSTTDTPGSLPSRNYCDWHCGVVCMT